MPTASLYPAGSDTGRCLLIKSWSYMSLLCALLGMCVIFHNQSGFLFNFIRTWSRTRVT